MMQRQTRRTILKGVAALAAGATLPRRASAQGEPIKIGILTPQIGRAHV